MAKNTETRIEERNRLAALHRSEQNPVMRAVSGAGLAIANTWDRITAPFKSDRTVFGGATAFGILRGMALGAAAGVLAVAATATVTAAGIWSAPLTIPIMLTSMGIGAVVSGIKDGQSKLEKHWGERNDALLSNKVAEMTGAVPSKYAAIDNASKNIKSDLAHPGRPSKVVAEATAAIESASPGFVEQENQRRARRGGPAVLH